MCSYVEEYRTKVKSANEALGLPRSKMKKIAHAFDVDGTLRNNTKDQPTANERIRTHLITCASFKNSTIICWSGSGELYARQMAHELGLAPYIDIYADKQDWQELRKRFTIIAYDDIQDTAIGDVNVIVREK